MIRSFEELPAQMGPGILPDPARHTAYSLAVKRQQTWYNTVVRRQA